MDFKAYINGKRKGKEAHKIERAAGRDSFLRDAIDGFDAVEGDHFSSIEFLEKQVEALSKPRNRRFQPLFWYGSAATILLLVALWIIFPRDEKIDYLANESKPALHDDVQLNSKDSFTNENSEIEPLPIGGQPKLIAQSPPKKAQPKEELKRTKQIAVVQEFVEDQMPETAQVIIAPVEAENKLRLMSTKANGINTTAAHTAVAPIATVEATKVLGDKLKGRVIDENGNALVGATVSFKDTYKSVLTDINGNFVIDIPKNNNRPLVLSYVGYETKEMAINEPNIEVKMQADPLALNEVVVVGYGSQKRTSRVGSVARVDNQEKKSPTEPIFGEKEFLRFYEVLRTKRICNTRKESLTARFYIDENGKATELQIEKASCEAMAEEFRKIVAQSPVWTKRDRIVIFRF